MKRSSYFLIINFALLLFNFSSCKKDEAIHDHTALTGLFKVEFEHSFDGAEFSFDSTYIDAQGDTLHFSKFDYYISNLQLVKSDGSIWSQPDSYFLIKSSDDLSRLISIADVPVGDYTGINFSIGVDSTHNVSGAQTGALDPANEMFWDWNTGYIFIKTEGTISTFFQASVFEYHIGGFQTANATNCVHKVSQTFGGSTLTIAPNTAPQIHMAVDLSRFFNGTSDSLSVASMPMIHDPGLEAVKAANRFQEAFEFEHLHQ